MSNELIQTYLLRWLSRREHSKEELVVKLVQRGYSRAVSRKMVELCQAEGWQSDLHFAKMLMQTRISQGNGWLKIKVELQQKGVNSSVMEQIVAEAKEVDWVEVLDRLLKKKNWLKGPLDAKQRRYLFNKGFELSQMMMAMNDEVLNDAGN